MGEVDKEFMAGKSEGGRRSGKGTGKVRQMQLVDEGSPQKDCH